MLLSHPLSYSMVLYTTYYSYLSPRTGRSLLYFLASFKNFAYFIVLASISTGARTIDVLDSFVLVPRAASHHGAAARRMIGGVASTTARQEQEQSPGPHQCMILVRGGS